MSTWSPSRVLEQPARPAGYEVADPAAAPPPSSTTTGRSAAAPAAGAAPRPTPSPTPSAAARMAAAARLRGTGGFPTHPDVALYDRLGQSLAYLATLGLAVLLWAVGAYFTLRFLDAWAVGARLQQLAGALGWPLSAAGGWWLTRLVPVALTTIEAFLTPPLPLLGGAARTRTRAHWLIWLAALIPDAATTAAGVIPWLAGLGLAGGPAGLLGLISSVLIALVPERLGRWAVVELARLWAPAGQALLRRWRRWARSSAPGGAR